MVHRSFPLSRFGFSVVLSYSSHLRSCIRMGQCLYAAISTAVLYLLLFMETMARSSSHIPPGLLLGLLYLYASLSGPGYHTVHLICISSLLHCLFAFHAPALFARHSTLVAKAMYTHGGQTDDPKVSVLFFRKIHTDAMHCVIGDASEIWVSS